MCLYIDDYDCDATPLAAGQRTARKQHRCDECGRTIDPAERYHFWTQAREGSIDTFKLCAHCRATIKLGTYLTGCPEYWYFGTAFDPDPEVGFVANCLGDEGHDLSQPHRNSLLRAYAASRRQWRWSDGSLMAVPGSAAMAAEVAA